MSFGGFIGSGGGGVSDSNGGVRNLADTPYSTMPLAASMAQPQLLNPPIAQNVFNSPALTLALKPKMEGHGEMGLMGENFDPSVMGRIREDGYESRSGSDNLEGASGDDQEAGGDTPKRKKRYHRHTPYQIQQLEAFFKENPHPDEKARLEIGKKLSLESKQVKFWFQNRRTQMKNRWAETFSCLIGRTATIDVISSGMTGTRSGALQLMHAELQVLSPLVPARQLKFIRFCKQHAEGVWAVVDVSVDTIQEGSNARSPMSCRRLPSGCIVQDMSNGYSKVTWVEHWEYDESAVHHLYRPLLSSGMGFGAQRWIATLQRQFECLAVLMSSTVPGEDQTAITPSGRRSIVKLAQRMTRNFYAGVCATVHKWEVLQVGNVGEDAKLMTRKNVDDPGEPSGVVLSATMSVWMPVSRQRLFDFLRNEQLRNEWDILSHGGPMQEMVHIAKGQDRGNSVSLLRASAVPGNVNQSSMLILQETWTDASGSLITYAPVDIPAMQVVINGGDSTCVALLPSGFAIVPDGFPDSGGPNNCNGTLVMEGSGGSGGSLLTVGFQILVNNLPSAKLTMESVETVNDLISQQIQKIKAALRCN